VTSSTPLAAKSARPTPHAKPPSWRNVIIYGVGVLALSTVAGLLMTSPESPAGLLFILSPILMAALLRWFGGDGWGDAGLRFRGAPAWYAVAALVFPVMFAVALGLGVAFGAVTFAEGAIASFATLFAINVIPRMLFSVGEEWGWRGYLEPRLAALGVAPFRRHLTVGAIWAVWHVPYIVALGADYTELNLAVQLPLFFVAVIAMAFLWGTLRTRTGSVWPAVIGHGVANAVAFPLLSSDVATVDNVLVFAARPEGLIVLALLSVAAFVVYRRWGRVA
jgi:membrane protease YdiL (CAAX protease family)